MKLYSRGQLFFYCIASSIIVVLFMIGFGLIGLNRKTENSTEPASITKNKKADEFVYETNISDPNFINVNDSSRFTEDELENIKVYQTLNEAVVNISIEVVTLNWFLEPVPREGGSGSGSVIDKRGYILTNRHVVENAYKVSVTLSDGSQFDGKVVGIDPENDLAVVKIEPGDKQLVTIPFGDSDELLVGQKVLAIGNPFGYERTLTTGVISGLGRPVKPSASGKYIIKDMIQTDASINPGNSGGPMISSRGEMIGINTMIYSPTGGSIGIGFAVPVNTARRVVPELIKFGGVNRGWIDIEPIQLFPELVKYASLPVSSGLLVSRVAENSSAEKAGMRGGREAVRYGRSTFYIGGDIIIEADGIKIKSLTDLYSALEDNHPGDRISVVVLRGKREVKLTVELSKRH